MLEFLTAGDNVPFTVSLTLMLFIALLEGVSTILGFGLSALLDSILPDLDLDADVPEVDSASGLTRLLGWLHVGRVPVLVLFILFLTGFGLMGLMLQSFVNHLTGHLLPAFLAAIPALMLAVPGVRFTGGVIARVMPQDETEAVSAEGFIGRVAIITLGVARAGSAAQAKLKDEYGQSHYVMVMPDTDDEEFPAGTEVLLVKRLGHHFLAIRNTHDVLSNDNTY